MVSGLDSRAFVGIAKAETPVLWPPHAKSWLIGKDSDAGRDRGQEEKGTTEDEMSGWHHWLDGHETGWTSGVDVGQGGLVCCDSRGCKESDTTEQLNWTDTLVMLVVIYSTDKHLHFLFFNKYQECCHVSASLHTFFLRYTLRNRIIELLVCVFFAMHKLP